MPAAKICISCEHGGNVETVKSGSECQFAADELAYLPDSSGSFFFFMNDLSLQDLRQNRVLKQSQPTLLYSVSHMTILFEFTRMVYGRDQMC